MLDRFVNAVEGTDIPNGSDKNWNNKDFGFSVIHVYGKTGEIISDLYPNPNTDLNGAHVVADNTPDPHVINGYLETEAIPDTSP